MLDFQNSSKDFNKKKLEGGWPQARRGWDALKQLPALFLPLCE